MQKLQYLYNILPHYLSTGTYVDGDLETLISPKVCREGFLFVRNLEEETRYFGSLAIVPSPCGPCSLG